MTCERCGAPIAVGDWPFCPHGKAESSVQGDEIDVIIENNGTKYPIRFRSRQALKKHLEKYSLQPFVRHQPVPGSDKSPHTVDWSKGMDPQTMENARILLSRPNARMADSPEPELPIEVTVRTLDTGFTVKVEREE